MATSAFFSDTLATFEAQFSKKLINTETEQVEKYRCL